MRFFFSILIRDICLLLAVAFFTLLERKILGYIQLRKGPNKVGFLGILQPFADALKLFSKERLFLVFINLFFYFFSPIFSLFLTLILWLLFPRFFSYIFSFFGIFFFFCISRMRVYSVLFAGWSSNSKYALLGSLRSVAQTISYEVRLVLILLSVIFLIGSFFFFFFLIFQDFFFWFFFLLIPVFFIWFVTILAETNRAPFDFAEGESELVSGFNIEYGGGAFALLFLAEYGRILIISIFSSIFFFGILKIFLIIILISGVLSFFFLWVRGRLPRIRYDRLIRLTWKRFLPVRIFYLFFSIFIFWIC